MAAKAKPAETKKRARPKRSRVRQYSGTQVLFAAILAIGLILAINFSRRITAGQPLQDTRENLLLEIEQLRAEQVRLAEQLEFVRGDAFVEAWARDDGKLVRPGEVLIIPVPSGVGVEPTPVAPLTVPVETSPPQPEPWQLWWALFFDSPPPEF